MKCFIVAVLLAVVAAAHPFSKFSRVELETNVWVVLAAGSDGWSNYRHQADVCHMYQVAHSLGVPDEHIIVIMKDDIANSASNPKKGQIINEPNGPDVYHGVPKDYTGSAVSSANFLKVLEGVAPGVGSGKVLKTTNKDHVFVFFDDHGTSGALCWPEGCSLTGPKFEATINTMASKQMFAELIIYVEACYAGSVFYKTKLPPNVYITTASPVAASSFAYNYDSTIRAYVADIYSWLFIHDTEVNPLSRTFNDQFAYIQDNIQNYSMACQYGDLEYGKASLESFWKPKTSATTRPVARPVIKDAVPSWDVPIETARRVYEAENSDENRAALKREEEFRERVDTIGQRIVEAMGIEKHFTVPPCTTCTKSCTCMQYCSGSQARCEMQCCNQQGCYVEPPKYYNQYTADVCTTQLTSAFLNMCGNDHAYLRSVDAKIYRACRGQNPQIQAALDVINAECSRD